MDAEEIYYKLRAAAEELGFVSDHADELLGDAARDMAEHPNNEE